MRQKRIKNIRRVVVILILVASGPLVLFLTSPRTLPLPLLILPFFWFFIIISGCLVFGYRVVAHRMPNRRLQLNFGLIAAIPVLLAILQSIHQLSLKDVILVLGLVAVATFYVSRLDIGGA